MELFNDFDKVSFDEWKQKIEVDLKGKDYQETLVWKSEEGIEVQPFYNNSTTPKNTTPLKPNNSWFINETIHISDIKEANKKALMALKGGANAITFTGEIATKKELNELLKDIQTEIITINFNTTNPKDIAGWVNLSSGGIGTDILGEELNSKNVAELAELTIAQPKINTIFINATHYHRKDSTIIHELAYALTHGVEYLNLLTEKGLTAKKIANNMQFTFSIGTNYFFEIAKLRAARILWKTVLNAYEINNVDMNISAITSSLDYEEEEVANNILRNTTKAMSAIIGGCDTLTVKPHENGNKSIDFTNRIARNVQHLLKEESFFDKVNNPADGSYYIENLTYELANKSWMLFKETEAKGGFVTTLKNNITID